MPMIDHDPDEPPKDKSKSPWWIVWPMVGLLNLGYFTQFDVDWTGYAAGGLTFMVLASWAVDVTGNRVPKSWRR